MLNMFSRKVMLILTLSALPFLVGSKCAFFFSSGDGSPDTDDEDRQEEKLIVVNSGRFGTPAIEGVGYESGSLAGVTGHQGEFQYENGNTIRFFIGDINLGEMVIARPVITPDDLVTNDTQAAINMLRLLLSLDSDPDDDIVTIPGTVRASAVISNGDLSAAIEFMDFSHDPAFVNAASQLVAVLTSDYPHIAMLVDTDTARDRSINIKPLGNDSK